MPGIHLFADGAVLMDNGKGGWGFVLVSSASVIYAQGFMPGADPNYVELLAVIRALDRLVKSETVYIYSDSLCVKRGVKRKRSSNSRINAYYNRLIEHSQKHCLCFIKVGKGVRPPLHRRAHHLAREAAFNNLTTCSVFPVFEDNDVEVCEEN